MNQTKRPVGFIKAGLAVALTATLMGCAAYVGGGYGGAVVAEPDAVVFGGVYDRGMVVHDYSHRGFVSRGVAHPGWGGRRR